MTVEQVAALAHEAAGNPERMAESIRRLDTCRRFILQAAYAYARRRTQDTAWRRAADLLELVILRRSRRPAGGARLWHRFELIAGVVGGLVGAMAIVQWRVVGRPSASAIMWIVFMFVHVWNVRRIPEMELERIDAQGTGRVAQATRDALAASTELANGHPVADDAVDALRAAAGHGRDEVNDALAAVALSRAERVVAGVPVRRRSRRLALLHRARLAQLDDVAPGMLTS